MRYARFVITLLIIAAIVIPTVLPKILPSVHAMYIKPSFPDYAPNGMPDFDEKQDSWGPAGAFTWCCPVAAANSLWWLDSEYESVMFASPVPPPAISDHFPLVTTYGTWDDHDPQNVAGLVANLAFLMDTDGQRTLDGHKGTRWSDFAPGIQQYLVQQGCSGLFRVQGTSFPDISTIYNKTASCQDVELFIEFWQQQIPGGPWTNTTITYPSWEFGHCLTVAGADASSVLVSDPYFDLTTPGLPSHNDAQFVSHDPYPVQLWMAGLGPYGPQPIYELMNYCQLNMGLPPTYHAFIRGAVATYGATVVTVAGMAGTTGYKLVFKETLGNPLCSNATVSYNWNFTMDKWNGSAWIASGISGSSPLLGSTIPTLTRMDLPYYVYVLPQSGSNAVKWGDWLKVSFTFHWTYGSIALFITYTTKVHVHPGDIAGMTPVTLPLIGSDGFVNLKDLGIITGNWPNPVPPGADPTSNAARADINGDGFVNLKDLGVVTSEWTKSWTNTPPPG